ncbi:MAG: flagellar brake domain-containing protein [Lachnospiraceae bacterium]|nr:flagellar brake domain-containing protein [Lachnospiraceae bacterium]
MASIISIGDKIELTKLNRSMTNEPQQEVIKYISKVLEKDSDYEMKIAMPIQGGKIIPLSVGESLMACFYSNLGAIYECRINITDRYKDGNIFILEIEIVSQLKKVQRRNFYRYSCMLAMQYIVLPEDADEAEAMEQSNPEVWKQAVAMDISGGGIRIASKIKEEEGAYIEIKLPLVNGKEHTVLYTKAKIIRALPSSQSGVYELRAEFVDILEADREEIIKYIFDMERKKRQIEKGLA